MHSALLLPTAASFHPHVVPVMIAYLDPATGSLLLQSLFGVILSIPFVIRGSWHRVAKLFGVRPRTRTPKR